MLSTFLQQSSKIYVFADVLILAFIDPGMNLIWTMMLYSRADINNVLVPGEIVLYTMPPFCL